MIDEIIELFKSKTATTFMKWLNKDKRRLILMKKVLNILIEYQDKRLTFDQILKEAKTCRSSLSLIIKKLRDMQMISDYDTEMMIQKTRMKGKIEYTAGENEERFYYRYKYRFCNSKRTALLLAAIWGLNIGKKK
jgi:hypothetical protein